MLTFNIETSSREEMANWYCIAMELWMEKTSRLISALPNYGEKISMLTWSIKQKTMVCTILQAQSAIKNNYVDSSVHTARVGSRYKLEICSTAASAGSCISRGKFKDLNFKFCFDPGYGERGIKQLQWITLSDFRS
jgi:hypothetical protein